MEGINYIQYMMHLLYLLYFRPKSMQDDGNQ